jgi:DNA polymerase-1
MKMIVNKAKDQGYVETRFGRRRYLPDIKASNFNVRSAAERIALNTPIQGTAADIIKLAMVEVYRSLKREGLKAKLILQVHDELIVECPPEELERVKELLKQGMEGTVPLAVPLDTSVSTGQNWLEAK